MDFVNVCLKENADSLITQSDIGKIELCYKADLKKLMCCNKLISDGCQIVLWDFDIIEVCNDCMFIYFTELLNIINKDKPNSKKIYTVAMQNRVFQVSNASLRTLRSKFNSYFTNLYKMHIRDDLFLLSTDFYIQKFVDKTRRVLGELEQETRIASKMTQGESRKFFNEKHITDDLSSCHKFSFTISSNTEKKKTEPLYKLESYSAISNIPCKISNHNKYQDAVYVLSDGRNNGFTFSFCVNHLLQFATILFKIYKNPTLTNIREGEFYIEKGRYSSPCYITNETHRTMYKLHLNRCIIVLSRNGLDLIIKTVLSSSALEEIYPIIAYQYRSFIIDKKQKETEMLQEFLEKEKTNKKLEIDELTEYYKKQILEKDKEIDTILAYDKKIISELKFKIKNLETENSSLKVVNSKQEYQLNHIDILVEKQNQENVNELRGHIHNCLLDKNVVNVGISKKSAVSNPVKEYSQSMY